MNGNLQAVRAFAFRACVLVALAGLAGCLWASVGPERWYADGREYVEVRAPVSQWRLHAGGEVWTCPACAHWTLVYGTAIHAGASNDVWRCHRCLRMFEDVTAEAATKE